MMAQATPTGKEEKQTTKWKKWNENEQKNQEKRIKRKQQQQQKRRKRTWNVERCLNSSVIPFCLPPFLVLLSYLPTFSVSCIISLFVPSFNWFAFCCIWNLMCSDIDYRVFQFQPIVSVLVRKNGNQWKGKI